MGQFQNFELMIVRTSSRLDHLSKRQMISFLYRIYQQSHIIKILFALFARSV